MLSFCLESEIFRGVHEARHGQFNTGSAITYLPKGYIPRYSIFRRMRSLGGPAEWRSRYDVVYSMSGDPRGDKESSADDSRLEDGL
jgi:hypothetical protein